MDISFTLAQLEKLFIQYATEEKEELNACFAVHHKIICGRIPDLLSSFLASDSISGVAAYSGSIFLNAKYFYNLLADSGLIRRAEEICGLATEYADHYEAVRDIFHALILHEYIHAVRGIEFTDIYKDPRFDDVRQRYIITAVAAIIEDVRADEFLLSLYPDDYNKSVKLMRTALALAVRESCDDAKDPLLCAAVRLLAPDAAIYMPESESADRFTAVFKKALSQKTLAGKMHFIEKIADMAAENEEYRVSRELILFLSGYETHFLDICKEFFSTRKQLVFSKPSSGSGTVNDHLISCDKPGINVTESDILMSGGEILVSDIPDNGESFGDADDHEDISEDDDNNEGDDSNESDDTDSQSPHFDSFNFSVIHLSGYSNADIAIYNNIVKIYSSLIKNYSRRIESLLQPEQETKERKLLYGSGIDSSRLADVKKRYWYTGNESDEQHVNFDVTFMMFCTMQYKAVDDIEYLFSKRCIRPHMEYISALIAATEVLQRNNISANIYNGVQLFNWNVITFRDILKSDEKDSKYQLGRVLREDNSSNLVESLCDPYSFFNLYYANLNFKNSSSADKHILIYISDYSSNVDKYYPDKVKDDCSASMSDVREMMRKDKVVFNAVAVDYNNKPDKMCYPVLQQAFPNVVQCTEREMLPKLLLSVIEKMIRSIL